MVIVCDQYIPFLVEAVQKAWPQVQICPMKPEQIDASAVREADVLVIRTRTQVNEALLSGSRVRLVCTATIGFDHIDTAYCDTHGIRWMSCPGCNAQAVCDYIEQAIEEFQILKSSNPQIFKSSNPPTIGVVGVGHVGSLVAKMAERKGLKVLLNDPPKGIGISLDKIAKNSDIITFHVPLTSSPLHGGIEGGFTYHLCDETFLSHCKPDALIINAARGGVVDEQALLHSGHPFILDTWENEPNLNKEVLQSAFRASMHIAGYSVQGKRNATQMCLNSIANLFQLPPIDISAYPYEGKTADPNNPHWLEDITRQLKAQPEQFETLRKNYYLR
ncbi:MAG: 4-phosphoerythronate dehydrogenase [Paludibacteraceae bacterium]|nr:4-phosphoerythronate dehydrogenase [Paludibacteraceae bacterium]